MSSACGPCRAARARDRGERLAHALVRRRRGRARAGGRRASRGGSRTARRAAAGRRARRRRSARRGSRAGCGRSRRGRRAARPGDGVAVVAEPPPDERELAPVRLALVLRADARGVVRELALVARDRLEQLVARRRRARSERRARRRARGPPRGAVERERACAVERLLDRVRRPRPGCRRGRRRSSCRSGAGSARRAAARGSSASSRRAPRRAGSARRTRGRGGSRRSRAAARPRTSSVCQSAVTSSRERRLELATPRAPGSVRVVELGQRRAEPQVRGEDRPPRRLGRVRRQDELERDVAERGARAPPRRRRPRAARTPRRATRAACAPRARTRDAAGRGGAARRCSRAGSRARTRAAPSLCRSSVERADRVARARRASRPRARARDERADPLLVREQALALLLDEHAPERVAEQADVPPKRNVRAPRW